MGSNRGFMDTIKGGIFAPKYNFYEMISDQCKLLSQVSEVFVAYVEFPRRREIQENQ